LKYLKEIEEESEEEKMEEDEGKEEPPDSEEDVELIPIRNNLDPQQIRQSILISLHPLFGGNGSSKSKESYHITNPVIALVDAIRILKNKKLDEIGNNFIEHHFEK